MRITSKIMFSINRHIRILFLFSGIIISSCRGNNEIENEQRITVHGQIVLKAERFRLEEKNGYTTLTIVNPWQGAENISQEYHLVRRGFKLPDGLDSSVVIFVPLQKIICMSTTHVAMITALSEENTISGVSGTGFVFSGKMIKNIEDGLVEDVGYEANLNKEKILNISPDIIMMYGIGNESAGYVGKIKELGVTVVFNADYLETDPLGKAEWIKMFGALYCKEKLADSIYNAEVETYDNLKSFIILNISDRPKVLLGLPFKDTWYISPGNSFISKLIADAGGNYLWKNTLSSVSMPFGMENVYLKALTADFWLNIGNVNSREEISVVDPRLTGLQCFENSKLFNNNKRITVNGGNDYWESGTVYPHLILKDIASILHPELFPGYELVYYRKIN